MSQAANDNPAPPPVPVRRIPIVGWVGGGDEVTFFKRPREFVELPQAVVDGWMAERDGGPR